MTPLVRRALARAFFLLAPLIVLSAPASAQFGFQPPTGPATAPCNPFTGFPLTLNLGQRADGLDGISSRCGFQRMQDGINSIAGARAQPGGIATLDSNGLVPLSQIPASGALPSSVPSIVLTGPGITCASGAPCDVSSVNMKLPDTGAILRSLQDKLKDQVDVEDFGAKCDGSSDDTAPFRAGVAALKARGRGGFLNLPPRACIISGTIDGASGVYIRGKGRDSTAILTNSPTGDVFRFGTAGASYNNFGMFDLAIGSTVTRTSGALIAMSGGRGTFRSVILRGGFDGMTIDNYGNQAVVDVNDLLAEGMTNECISLGKFSTSPALFANGLHLSGSTLAQCGTSMAFYSASGIYVQDVESYQARGTAYLFQPSTNHIGIQGVWINQTLADSSAGDGWYFAGTGKIGEVKITSSQASSSGGHGLEINPGTNLDSLQITDFQSTFNVQHGMRIGGGTNVTVRGGEFYHNGTGSGGLGIAVENNVGGFTIQGIQSGYGGWAKINNVPTKQSYGIYVVGPNNNNYIISGNRLMGNLQQGLSDNGTGTNKIVEKNLTY